MVHVFSYQEITNERFFEILFLPVNVVVKRTSIEVHICNLNRNDLNRRLAQEN